MSKFLKFLGASRGCADFRDPTAVFRIMETLYLDAQLFSHEGAWKLEKLPLLDDLFERKVCI